MNRDRARNLAQLNGAVSGWRKWTTVVGVVLLGATSSVAQTAGRQNRIAQDLSAKPNVEISGSIHSLTTKSTDLGAVNSNMQMNSLTLHVRPSAAQKKEIASLLGSMQDRKSPQYHKWLTQAEYGARFGLTGSDLSQVKSWLSSQGFTVKSVSTSRNSITFGGKAWQVESAFHTQLHRYQLDGETHFANASALHVPAQFADVVMAVRGLDNFRPKPNAKRMLAHPNATFGTSNYISPRDWATIYNASSLSDGAGIHIGVVGQSYAPASDIDNFRTASGLPTANLVYSCISAAAFCNNTASGDLAEADVDIEWAGGIAPKATVDYIYAGGGGAGGGDPDGKNVLDALSYAVYTYLAADGNVLPIISMSYDFGCEASVSGSPLLGLFDALGQQAGLQGQTLVVAAGDSGAAGCDGLALSPFTPGPAIASKGLAVTVPADNPAFTAVGGTTLFENGDPTLFWNPTDGLVNSALGYIPEMPWNEASVTGTLAAGGGGESTATDGAGNLLYPQPNWQSGLIAGSAGRLVPDIAFAAAAAHDGYLYCSSDTANGNLCASGAYFASGGTAATAGGTSVATPAFAGLLARLVQQYGPLGNINPALYAIAADSGTYGSPFHDVTSGDTNVPCQTTPDCPISGFIGFSAAPGYDQATGLGSMDGLAMSTALSTYLSAFASSAASTTTVSASPNPAVFGSAITITATVNFPVGAPTPTGSVTFSTAGGLYVLQPMVAGVATISVPATVANGLAVGSDSITAAYTTDTIPVSTNASHASIAMTVTLAATTATIAQPGAVIIGGTTILSVSVASTTSSEFATGTVTFKLGSKTLGTATLTNGTATQSVTAVTASGFILGSNLITASYSGDANFTTSTGSTTLTVLGGTTTTIAQPNAVTVGHTTSLSANVTSTTVGTISGTVTFKLGSTTIGTAPVTGGVATLSNIAASASNGFSIGPNAITASYGGDANFATSTGSTTLTVNALAATTTIAQPSAVTVGHTTSLSATVTSLTTGTIGGTVTFQSGSTKIGTASLTNGTATLSVTASVANGFSIGSNSITAGYSGDTNFAASTGSTTLTVNALAVTITAMAPPSAVTIGHTTTLSASVTSSTAGTIAGTVTFKLGSATLGMSTLANGTATLSVVASAANGFIVGLNSITASFNGDTNFATSAGGSTTLTVTAAVTTTTVAQPVQVAFGGMASLSASVASTTAGTITGTVTFKLGSATLGTATLTNGTATLSVAASTANGFIVGSNSITASYSGDAIFTPSTGTSKTLTVVLPSYTLTASPTSVTVGANGSSTITLTLTTTNYAGTVDFATSVTSTNGAASNISVPAPSSVTLGIGSGSTQTTTMAIAVGTNAANHAPAVPWKSGGALVFCAVLLGVPYSRRKRVVAVLLTALAISLAGFMMACGGSSASTTPKPPPAVTARTYKVTVTPTGSSPVANPSPVVITVTVP